MSMTGSYFTRQDDVRKKLSPEELETIGAKPTPGALFVICDKPQEHYDKHPEDYMSIGMGGWVPADSVSAFEDWELDRLHGGFLCDLQINEGYQGQGLAQKLVEARIEDIYATGLNTVTTITPKDNAPINHILKKFGFEIYHKDENLLYHELSLRKT